MAHVWALGTLGSDSDASPIGQVNTHTARLRVLGCQSVLASRNRMTSMGEMYKKERKTGGTPGTAETERGHHVTRPNKAFIFFRVRVYTVPWFIYTSRGNFLAATHLHGYASDKMTLSHR
jgi:hypothetical protein